MDKKEIKRIVDNALGIEKSFVEPTLERNEYYIYTEVWFMSMEQLDNIREKIKITDVSVDGGRIMLTAKV